MTDQEDAIEVTAENFGGLLVAAMDEARQITRGDRQPARSVRRAIDDEPRPLNQPGGGSR